MSNLETYAKLIIASGPNVYYPEEGGYFAGVIDTRESDPNGLRYLLFVASKENGETQANWGYDRIKTRANSSWNGYENAQKIIDSPAASFCRRLNLNGHGDWYLPAKDELNILYQNSAEFVADTYWSSTECNTSYVGCWYQNFYDGFQNYFDKYRTCHVRAVRRLVF